MQLKLKNSTFKDLLGTVAEVAVSMRHIKWMVINAVITKT
jgi:hypothetical protein